MASSLDDKIEHIASGSVVLHNDGSVDFQTNTYASALGGRLGIIKEIFCDGGSLLFSKRDSLPYMGKICWYQLENEMSIYAMKSREGATFQQMRTLYAAFEAQAQEKHVEMLSALALKRSSGKYLTRGIMSRFGWFLVHDGKYFGKFQKNLFS